MDISREARIATGVVLDTTLADSQVIPYGHASGGEVRVPAASAITTLTWWSSETEDGTYLACYDAANAAVTQTVAASQANCLPDALFGRKFLKAVPNANGTVAIVTKT